MEKPYFEIRITFLHIAVFLCSILLIAVLLFVLGYRAGKASMSAPDWSQAALEKEARIDPGRPDSAPPAASEPVEHHLQEELSLHGFQESKEPERKARPEPETTKAPAGGTVFQVQVGAFANYANARQYAERFRKMGYSAEINSSVSGGRDLFRVRVGRFANRAEAEREKEKLEKAEKQKFSIVSAN